MAKLEEQTATTDLADRLEQLDDATARWHECRERVVDEVRRLSGMGFSPFAIEQVSGLELEQVRQCLTAGGVEFPH